MKQEILPRSTLEILATNKKELDELILDFLPKTTANKEINILYDMMRDYPSRGGKGFRGSLCLLWCELFGGKRENALATGAALELFQNWILIHDDIEDESDLRRGLPALHKKYGIPLSINAGDALHGKMWELLLQNHSKLNGSAMVQILQEFSTMLNETTEGQQLELYWGVSKNWNISEQDYLLMVRKKAAWYTCISPSRMGVILARASSREKDESWSKVLDQIVLMGTDMGIAFQIVDDILNLTASQAKYGKEILGDILEGKRTLMLIHLLQKCSREEKENIIKVLSKPRKDKTIDEASSIYGLMKEKGSIEHAQQIASKHATRGLSRYDTICKTCGVTDSDSFGVTRHLLEYLVKRDY